MIIRQPLLFFVVNLISYLMELFVNELDLYHLFNNPHVEIMYWIVSMSHHQSTMSSEF